MHLGDIPDREIVPPMPRLRAFLPTLTTAALLAAPLLAQATTMVSIPLMWADARDIAATIDGKPPSPTQLHDHRQEWVGRMASQVLRALPPDPGDYVPHWYYQTLATSSPHARIPTDPPAGFGARSPSDYGARRSDERLRSASLAIR